MNYLKRFLLLFAATGILFSWAGGLQGGPAWLVRALVVLASAGMATRWAVSPWREAERAARRVREGDLQARLDDVIPGDTRAAAAAFNAMAEHLAELRKLSAEREGRFQAVLAAGGRTILLMDREGTILLTSPATRRMFPSFREDAMVASLGLPGLSQLVEDALTGRQPQFATFSESPGGRGRVFETRAVPLDDGGVVVILDEVTTQVRLDRVKADLVANVSHELRTPLAAASSLLETLEAPDLTSDQRAHFEARLRGQVGRMSALVDDLLTLSRLEGEKVSPVKEALDLGVLVRDLFATLEPAARSGKVRLIEEIPEGGSLSADRALLDTILKNLVDNAIRYNRPGGTVTVRSAERDDAFLIEVEDTGEGIPATHLDRIFERFYRVDPHRSREKGGTGLGLAIVKHAAAQLGGSVSVESTAGAGSTFRVELPAHPEPEQSRQQNMYHQGTKAPRNPETH
jgi:two-component system, OmpR family, phosphate regulon sensor histidine kinase PhoR